MKSLCFAKRARNLLLFVWSSCHCGCERGESDVKRDGWVSCFIICHFGRNSKEAMISTIQKNPRLQHTPLYSVISTHKAQFVTLYSSLCLYNKLPDRLVFLNTVTLICLIQFFRTLSWHRITYVQKK